MAAKKKSKKKSGAAARKKKSGAKKRKRTVKGHIPLGVLQNRYNRLGDLIVRRAKSELSLAPKAKKKKKK